MMELNPHRKQFVKWLNEAKRKEMNMHESDLGHDHLWIFTDIEDGTVHAIFQCFCDKLTVYATPAMNDIICGNGGNE